MFKSLRLSLLAVSLLPVSLSAQDVDRTKYPDYSDAINPDYSLMKPMNMSGAEATAQRPDHVNNAETPYFPPVFNQAGGSCGSASRICYMFSHELNSFRGLDGKNPDNYYPSHFVWLLTCGNSGKNEFVQYVGVPSATTYGGQTFSKLFGYQEDNQDDFGWMQGYEKWYSGMFNRMLAPVNFPVSVQTEEGREAVKNYLWNHNGDTDFHSGGIVGIGVAAGGKWFYIDKTPTNDALGVTGQFYVKEWGEQVNHALTIVGYDDRIEFDINGNGVYGEESADEKGAWIIVNSWGDWCNGGFIYCPYAYAVPQFKNGYPHGDFWAPEIYHVRKNYRPLRTIKLKMDYSRRSELYLSGGVSSDLNATEPQSSVPFEHFKYAGDGHNGQTRPAPEIPMLGRWADGKLHTEPMEFGYDLTDVSASFDKNMPLKYFFVIETKNGALGEGTIREASIIDYEKNLKGVETPFNLADGKGVKIENDGKRTIISVIVQGHGVYAPQNALIADGKLTWDAPIVSAYKLTGYNIYNGDKLLTTVAADVNTFALPSQDVTAYSVSALYGDTESSKITVSVPSTIKANCYVNFKRSGFSIPDVFGSKYDEASIEFWVNCNSVMDWNQSAGPGWGQFMFHANSDGTLTAGWDTNNRVNVGGAYKVGAWQHIALVVKKNILTVYVNGRRKTGKGSKDYSGIGGFGDLVFTANEGHNSFTDAKMDEIRIWKKALTEQEVRRNYRTEFGDAALPEELIAYFKGDLININGKDYMRDHSSGQHHATILNENYTCSAIGANTQIKPSTAIAIAINKPTEPIYYGIPVKMSADTKFTATELKWTAKGAGVENLAIASPNLTFKSLGKQSIIAQATNTNGETASDTIEVEVLESEAPDASFTMTKTSASAGENISLQASHPKIGYMYKWTTPGADEEEATSAVTAISYQKQGQYTITLTITTPDGKTATSSKVVDIKQVAPRADFDITPNTVTKGEKVTLLDKSKFDPKTWKWQLKSPANVLVGEGSHLTFIPEQPGMYDVSLTVSNEAGESTATLENGLLVCNADSKNGLSFNNPNAQVTLMKSPIAEGDKAFTIDWWMRPSRMSSIGNAIGNDLSDLLITTNANNQMVVQLRGKTLKSEPNFVKINQWHHYAVALDGGKIVFYRDGYQISYVVAGVPSMPKMESFKISNPEAPIAGQIDEFRVWNRALKFRDLQKFINQPLEGEDLANAEKTYGLQVYYQFNQNGGDVKDMTSHQNTGIRTNFGPEGDAWGLSKGVFALNFNTTKKDVTSRHLRNYKSPFTNNGRNVNGQSKDERFMSLANWTTENRPEGKTYSSGAHVDKQKNSSFAISTTWDGFAEKLFNHKAYQTITLQPGSYMFTANYGEYEGEAADCYLAASKGKGLPNVDALTKESLASVAMKSKSANVSENSIFFTISEPTEVSLGIVSNMAGQQNFNIESFKLYEFDVTNIEGLPDGIEGVVVPTEQEDETIYTISGQRILTPEKGQVYIIGGKKVLIK